MSSSRLASSAVLALGLFLILGGLSGQSSAPDVIAVLKGHGDTIEAVAISPDGTLVATASYDRNLRLFDLATAREVRAYGGEQGHKGQVLAVAFNAKGDQIATGGADNVARIWDVPVTTPVKTFATTSAARRAIVALDGKTVGVAGSDGMVKALPLGEEKGAIELKGHTGAVTRLGLTGTTWVTAGVDRTIRFWAADGKSVGQYALGTADFTGMGVGQSVFTTSSDNIMRQWQLPPQSTRLFPVLKDAVTAFAASADGNTILTATADRVVTLGSVSNNQAVATFTSAKAAVQVVALSPDNATSAAGCADGSVTLWDRQGKVRAELAAHANGVAAMQFHPSQPLLYTGGGDGLVKPWTLPVDPKQPKEKAVKHTIKAHTGTLTALVIHPTTGQVITAGADKLVRIWDPTRPNKPLREIGPLAAPVVALTISRDGQLLAGSLGKTIHLWNPMDGKEVSNVTQSADVLAVGLSADKSRLLLGRSDNQAVLVEVKGGAVVQTFPHTGPVRGVLAHPTTPAVITASADKSVVIAPITVQRLIPLAGKTNGLVLSPDNQRLLTVGPGKTCVSYLSGNSQKEREFATSGDASAAAFTKDGQRIAVAGIDGTVNLYTTGDGKLIGTIAAGGPVTDLAFHPSTPHLVGIRKTDAVVWTVAYQPGQPLPPEFGRAIQTFPHPKGVSSPVFNGQGLLYTVGEDKLLRQFRIASDTPVKNFQHPNLVDCVAFDDTGNRLATGCHDGILRIWDVVKNTPIKTINAHVKTMPRNEQDPIYAVLWTPDYKQVFTASFDKTIKLWDAASGQLVREFKAAPDPKPIEIKKDEPEKQEKKDTKADKKELPKKKDDKKGTAAKEEPTGPPGHRDQVFSMALTKNGKLLATGSSDGSIKLWDVTTGRVVRDFPNPDLKAVFPGELAPSHPGWIQCVRFTPGDQFLVSAGRASRDRSYLAVWKVADGKRIYGTTRDFGPIHSVAVTPDGTRLVIGCGTVRGKPGAEALIVRLPTK